MKPMQPKIKGWVFRCSEKAGHSPRDMDMERLLSSVLWKTLEPSFVILSKSLWALSCHVGCLQATFMS